MSRPRVLLITYARPESARGGVETFSSDLRRVFPGIECLAAEDLTADLSTGRLRELRLLRALAREATRRHLEEPYDLIIANGSLAAALPRPLPGRPVPVVVVMHGDYAGYSRRAMTPWHPKTLYTMHVASRWERESARRGDAVVAVSEGVARDVRRHYGCEPVVVHNGVEPASGLEDRCDARARLTLAADRPVVAFVGRPTREKGYDRLLRLAVSRPAYQFVVASPTPPRSAPPRARLFVDPDAETIRAIYRSCDALFFPSRFEGCAYVPLEAMAAGAPVVTSATGVFARRSGPFAGGWVVDRGRPDDWRRAVETVIRTPRTFDPVGYIRTRFSFDAFAAGYRGVAVALAPEAFGPFKRLASQSGDEPAREVRVA
jgi:glycosyltransferase involved in cell wall biosynthesis